jgi:glutamate/tyrosine decarboxylase-like PLP-dependent enzyme
MKNDLLSNTAQRAINYLNELPNRNVAPTQQAIDGLNRLGGPFPDDPIPPETVLEMLDTIGSPATMATAGPRFFGFVIGGVLPASLAANWLAGAWDQNAFSSVVSPTAVALEKIAAQWLLDALHLPSESSVSFVTGATMANFTALAAARQWVLDQAGWDVESQGLFGAPPITVIAGAEAHPTVLKSLGMLGLGRDRVVFVPADNQGRFRAGQIPAVEGPAIVCLQAGNVNTGSFDPIAEICDMVKPHGAWVHVDGAFGLWALASPKRAHLAADIDKADSWATDGHKWLNVPYDCGLAFVRRSESLARATAISAAYLPPDDRLTPEASRRARGVEVWAALMSLGRSGLADLIERNCEYAARFADGFRKAGYEILSDVVLNQVLVSFGDEDKTRSVISAVQQDGTCWCGGTVWQGKTAMRISVSSWATTKEDVEKSLTAMLEIAGRVT